MRKGTEIEDARLMVFQKGKEFGQKMHDHSKTGAMRELMYFLRFIIIVYGKYAIIGMIMSC
jgi:hypothetical protein